MRIDLEEKYSTDFCHRQHIFSDDEKIFSRMMIFSSKSLFLCPQKRRAKIQEITIMLECLEIRIVFWVVATIMAAKDRFSLNRFSKWLQNIWIVNFPGICVLWKVFSFEPGFHLIRKSTLQYAIKSSKNTKVEKCCGSFNLSLLIKNALRIKLMIFGWLNVDDGEQYY